MLSLIITFPHLFLFLSFLFSIPPLGGSPFLPHHIICSPGESRSFASLSSDHSSSSDGSFRFRGDFCYGSSMGCPACHASPPGPPTSRVDAFTARSGLWRVDQLCQKMAHTLS